MLRSLRFGLRRLLNPNASDRELTGEVQAMLEMIADEHVRRGLSRQQAMRQAQLDLGGAESVKEQLRTDGWEAAIESAWRDLRYAGRGMVRNPTFTFVVVATIALGIAANTAMFSVLNAVMLRPLPYADAGRLSLLWTDDVKRGLHTENTAYATITDWQRGNRTFEEIAFFNSGRATVGTGPTGDRTKAAHVSGNLFQVLGVAPAAGRGITDADTNLAAPVAVISHSLWTRRFAADPAIIGKPLVLDEWQNKGGADQLTIVGVMPPGFYFPDRNTEIWTPATLYWRWTRESSERFPSWARRWIAIGRLRPDASVADAREDLSRIGDQLAATHPSTVPDFPGFAVNVVPMLDSITGVPLQRALWLLMAAVGLVLLVACANVANLLLSRGAARQQEFAMRRALGASRFRLIRQQLIESLALAAAGGLAGVALSIALTRVITVLAAQRVPRLDEGGLDARVLVFAGVASLVSACVFGLVPALRVTSADRFQVMRPRGLMLIAECALAVVLLVGAGLLVRSLALVRAVDPGFDTSRVLLTRIQFPSERPGPPGGPRPTDSERALRREQVQQALLDRVGGLPDVESAGFVDDMFVAGVGNKSIAFPGMALDAVAPGELNTGSVSPGFFSTLRVPLRAGRYLNRDDGMVKIRALWNLTDPRLPLAVQAKRAIAEPVVVNEAFVKRYLDGQDPVGQRFCIDPTGKTYWFEIVGVVGDMRRQGLERAAIPEYFGPYTATASGRVDLVTRTRANPLAAAASVKDAVAAAVPGALVPQITTAAGDLGAFGAQRTLQTLLLTSFAALALLLTAIGIYGMVHYAVSQRTREIGVRIAIGARPRDVFARVVADGMRVPVLGLALGLVGAGAATRVMSHLLFGVDASDGITFAAVAITLLLTAVIACYGPARRAARIDAVTALRTE
jgi:putative ABC transport system permease protein